MSSPERPCPEIDLLFRQALRPYRQCVPRGEWPDLLESLPPAKPTMVPAATSPLLRLLAFLEWIFIQPMPMPPGAMQMELLNRQCLAVRIIS